MRELCYTLGVLVMFYYLYISCYLNVYSLVCNHGFNLAEITEHCFSALLGQLRVSFAHRFLVQIFRTMRNLLVCCQPQR